jgi:hypothetical protein
MATDLGLCLLRGVANIAADFVVQAGARRIREEDLDVWILSFKYAETPAIVPPVPCGWIIVRHEASV